MIGWADPLAATRVNRRVARLGLRRIGPHRLGPGGRAPLLRGIGLHGDPEGTGDCQWSSPPGRVVEISVAPRLPGRFLALHLGLPLRGLGAVEWLGLTLRGAADPGLSIRPCLRSGLASGGFHDSFFPRNIALVPMEAEVAVQLCPRHDATIPTRARWREIVLFLPPARAFALALHDLRISVG